jgi:hypothetical protein
VECALCEITIPGRRKRVPLTPRQLEAYNAAGELRHRVAYFCPECAADVADAVPGEWATEPGFAIDPDEAEEGDSSLLQTCRYCERTDITIGGLCHYHAELLRI